MHHRRNASLAECITGGMNHRRNENNHGTETKVDSSGRRPGGVLSDKTAGEGTGATTNLCRPGQGRRILRPCPGRFKGGWAERFAAASCRTPRIKLPAIL